MPEHISSQQLVDHQLPPVPDEEWGEQHLMVKITTDGDTVDFSHFPNWDPDDVTPHPSAFTPGHVVISREDAPDGTTFRGKDLRSGEANKLPPWLTQGTALLLRGAGVEVRVGTDNSLTIPRASINVEAPHPGARPDRPRDPLIFTDVLADKVAHAALRAGLAINHELPPEKGVAVSTGQPIRKGAEPGYR